MRILKRVRGRWYVYEVKTKYLGPVERVGTKEERRRITLNPRFFDNGRFRFSERLESILRSLLDGKRVTIEGIYIYGSQVTGRYSLKSDLDVWVKVRPRRREDKRRYSGPTLITASSRTEGLSAPRAKLDGVEVEVCRSTFNPKPPYFDVRRQRLVGWS
jgi:hypothetical protein